MKKPRKPFLAWRASGKKQLWYYRATWTEEGKRRERFIPLPGNPDSPEFDRAYWAIRSGQAPVVQPEKKNTWRDLVIAYRQSPRFRNLAPKTVKSYNEVIESILEKNASKSVSSLTRPDLRTIHASMQDTPRKADMLLQIISILTNFARSQLDWDIQNPAEGLEKFGTQREYEAWPDWLIEAFPRACIALGDRIALMAFHLGMGTGQRPGDLCAMEWQHFDGSYIQVTPDKQRESGPVERMSIYCPAELRKFLGTEEKRGKFMLSKNLPNPLDYAAVEKRFRKIRDTLGPEAKPFTLHGLRKNAASELASAGCSDAEIQSVTGHKSVKMVQHYRKAAQQKSLSRQAQQRREQIEVKK